MNNNIVPFNNAALGCSVRTVIINNDPWFVAKDVCEALEINNTSDTLKKVLDDDEDRCIRVDGEPISYGVAVGLLEQIERQSMSGILTTLPNATTRTDTTTTN